MPLNLFGLKPTGLRENIRALGEYAVENGKAAEASRLVSGFFSALDNYDRILFDAVKGRGNDGAKMDLEDASMRLKVVVENLDSLLLTVPPDVMAKSRTILAATEAKKGDLNNGEGGAEDDELLKALMK